MLRLLGRGSHRFRRSALSSSVPLDGSDTVVGLRQLDRHRRSQDLHSYLDHNLAGLQNASRKGYQRYPGPYLDQLVPQDLQTKPVPWVLALCGGSKAMWTRAYNLPEHTGMLVERLEENIVRYRGNYLRMAAGAALAVSCAPPLNYVTVSMKLQGHFLGGMPRILYPWAFVGLLCLVGIAHMQLEHLGSSSHTNMASVMTNGGGPPEQSFTRTAVHAALCCITLASRCFMLLPRCMLAAILVVLLHAALRRARSEYGSIDKRDLQAQAAAHELDLARLEADRLSRGVRPGWGFAEVWHGTKAGDPSADPRRVFRELWAQGKGAAAFAAGCCTRLAKYYWYDAWERLRTWRVPSYV